MVSLPLFSHRVIVSRFGERVGIVLTPLFIFVVFGFPGPVFRTDDLMQVFRNASIPSSTGIRARSPPPRGGGRPGPDYGPYQGPGGGRRGRY